MKISGKLVLSNFVWRFLERVGAQGVTFIVSLFLARILSPEDYGTVSLILVITAVLQVFVDSGLGCALIQKKDPDDLDYSSVFFFNIFICLILYGLLFVTAPFISTFYKKPSMTPQIRVLGLVLIISGVKNILIAYISKHMQFRKFFFATLAGTIGAGIIGIVLAIRGYGVWAIIYQNLFNQFIDTVILWLSIKWKPKVAFSIERLKSLLGFGSKMLFSSLLETVYGKCRELVIGKKYTSADLAFYNKGNELPYDFTLAVSTSIDGVLFPVMSEAQNDLGRVKQILRQSIKVGVFFVAPIMVGFSACAETIVRLLYSAKWDSCIPYFRIFSIGFVGYPIIMSNMNAIKAQGRSDIFFKVKVIEKIIGILLILITFSISVKALAYGAIISYLTSAFITSYPNRKYLGYTYTEMLCDVGPELVLAFLMGIAVYSVQFLNLSQTLTICIQIPLGVLIYWIGAKLLNLNAYTFSISLLRNIKNKGR